MSFANRESFASFPTWIPYISFSSLIAVARTSNTMLNSSGERGIFVLFLILQEMLSICLPLRIMFAVGLLHMAFTMLRYVPSMSAFWRVLIINGC